MSINKIKQHDFFKPIKFSDIEKLRIKMPVVDLKNPKTDNFDEIEFDSDDEDFAHEYEELIGRKSSNDDSSHNENFSHLKETF